MKVWMNDSFDFVIIEVIIKVFIIFYVCVCYFVLLWYMIKDGFIYNFFYFLSECVDEFILYGKN